MLFRYYAKKSGRSVQAATGKRPETAIKWSCDQAKITVFRAFDPHYVTFLYTNIIYQNFHISYDDIMQIKSGRSVQAATRKRPKTAIKLSRDQVKITVFGAFDPIT